jgi:guanylate kinase
MKLILVGKAASGKDHLKKKIESKVFKSGISYTTRQPRQNEKEGEDYYFVSEEQFDQIIESGQMLEWMEFNNWKYGLSIEEFEKADVMIMSKDGLDMLPKAYRDRCLVIYLDIPRMIRVQRLNDRNDINDSIWRRMSTDDEQFDMFKDFDIRIKNEDF